MACGSVCLRLDANCGYPEESGIGNGHFYLLNPDFSSPSPSMYQHLSEFLLGKSYNLLQNSCSELTIRCVTSGNFVPQVTICNQMANRGIVHQPSVQPNIRKKPPETPNLSESASDAEEEQLYSRSYTHWHDGRSKEARNDCTGWTRHEVRVPRGGDEIPSLWTIQGVDKSLWNVGSYTVSGVCA